ncbi:MAG: flippase-like domain-containing protein, partial [Anaerolineae bacterium]|nr:flippase-like domain-containing protein [Anaerolineae bacterium]
MRKIRFLTPVLWIFVGLLFWWAWRDISLPQLWESLHHFTPLSLGILGIINAAILLLFGSRWWLILRALGYDLPYLSLAKYRLASFGVSYFTPGPQFGGEPLQVYFLHKNHQVPTETALASVSLDKLLEMLANFTFLVFGVMIILWQGLFFDGIRGTVLSFSVGILLLILGYS